MDKVVLLGRTLEEYRHYFALDLEKLRGQAILKCYLRVFPR